MKRSFATKSLFRIVCASAVAAASLTGPAYGQTVDGYRGIWFTLNQFSQYGDKYSGGLGTYTAHHIPMAVYAPEVEKTFFVYGGTTGASERYLLCMIGSYDHKTGTLERPRIVHDKQGVDDPHDNPSLLIDGKGYVWVFVSGRNTSRQGYKYRSLKPWSIDGFERVSAEVFTYPQPWFVKGKGFFHFFTKYTGVRELYFETSRDGVTWSEDRKLAGIRAEPGSRAGHYQVSNHRGKRIVTFFNWHPDGNVDKRTNIYYAETTDFGKTWTTIRREKLPLPLTDVASPARVSDYHARGLNVYLCDVNFDVTGNPVCVYVLSRGHEPGPGNGLREWRCVYWTGSEWRDTLICTSDHNYDMGSLLVEGDVWKLIAPTDAGPQIHGSGGELCEWRSADRGATWTRHRQITSHSDINHNYVRRVVNGRPPFLYFWADGNPDKQSASRLYFGDGSGVWQMPYEMTATHGKPVKVQ